MVVQILRAYVGCVVDCVCDGWEQDCKSCNDGGLRYRSVSQLKTSLTFPTGVEDFGTLIQCRLNKNGGYPMGVQTMQGIMV